MSDLERELLLGYLFGALEEHENQELGDELEQNERLRFEFAAIRNEVKPIQEYAQWSKHQIHPPQGLAKRTARKIWNKIDSQTSLEPSLLERTRIEQTPVEQVFLEQSFLEKPPPLQDPLNLSSQRQTHEPRTTVIDSSDKSFALDFASLNSLSHPLPITTSTAYEAVSQFSVEKTEKNIPNESIFPNHPISNHQTENSTSQTQGNQTFSDNNESKNDDGRKNPGKERVSYRTLLKIARISRPPRSSQSKGWRIFDILTTISVCAMLVVLSLTAVQYVKEHVRKVYYAKMLQNMGLGEAVFSSHYHDDATYIAADGMLLNGNPRTDLGSILTSFTEVDLSQNSLDMVMPYENVKHFSSMNPGTSAKFHLVSSSPNFNGINVNVTSVPITYTTAATNSFSNFQQILPFVQMQRGLDQEGKPNQFSQAYHSNGQITSRILIEQWGYTQTPTLLKATGGTPVGTLYKTDDGSNVFYRDDRIFFKKYSP